MASKCTVTFDNNPLGVYYAGQTLSGVAELITARPKTIRSIFISINGFAEVRWTENIAKLNSEGKRETGIETFSGSELYFTSEKYVYGQNGGNQIELPAGKYVYPFQATIPPNAPTSFNGADGQIQYEVVMVIDRVLRYNNTFKQAFTVISPFDLNLNPAHANPMEQEEQKVFCMSLCCGNKNPIIMKVKVPFSGYAPGQKIRFNVLLDNQSDVNCSDIKVRLLRKATYTSRSPDMKTRWNEIKIAQNSLGGVIKHNKAELNEMLEIPSTVPSSLENCSIIKITYTLRFTVKLAGFYTDLEIGFPMTIGTLPLYVSAMENQNSVVVGQPGSGPIYKPLPQPMFEEDISAKEKFQDNPFIARYPVFSFRSGPPNGNQNPAGNLYPNTNPQSPVPHPSTPSIPYPGLQTNGQQQNNAGSAQIGWKP